MIRNRCCNHSCRRMCCSSQLEHSKLVRKLLHKLLEHSMMLLLEHSKLVRKLLRMLNHKLLVHSRLARMLEHSKLARILEHSKMVQRCIHNHDCS